MITEMLAYKFENFFKMDFWRTLDIQLKDLWFDSKFYPIYSHLWNLWNSGLTDIFPMCGIASLVDFWLEQKRGRLCNRSTTSSEQ